MRPRLAFNVSAERSMKVSAIVSMLQAILGKTHLKPEIRNEAREILEWRPAFDHEAGLRETVAWYRNFLAR